MRRRPAHHRRGFRAAAITAAVLAACKFSASGQSQDAGDDALHPPDASLCAAASIECATPTVLRSCSAPGVLAVDEDCAWGCRITPGAHCARIDPAANVLQPGDVAPGDQLTDVVFAAGIVIDGDTGRIGAVGPALPLREPGSGVINGIEYVQRGAAALFRVNKLQIQGSLSLIGNRSIVFAVDGDVTIEGVIDAQGGCVGINHGPGGFAGGTKQGGAGAGPVAASGGRGAIGDNEG
ncbi:MAG: hypothetical protein M3680_35220, partial [Myxococcota bacterium]|nr:hypothetical protein [Myxococcota bacterium]